MKQWGAWIQENVDYQDIYNFWFLNHRTLLLIQNTVKTLSEVKGESKTQSN
jgi:hypothetical protein